MTEYPPHDLALLIPPMDDVDYQTLRDSIAEQGLLRAITLHEGKVLDGIHRQRAALELGLKPRYEKYAGGDPLGFVVAANVARRQLNTTERAKLGALIAARIPDGRSTRKKDDPEGAVAVRVALQVGTGSNAICQALRLLREAPDVFEQMDGRTLKLTPAYGRLTPKSRGGQRRRPAPEDVPTLDERRAQRHMRDVAAWKRVIAVNGAAQKMWVERDEVLGAVDRCRDPGAVVALAGQVSRSIWQLREVADRALARLTPEQRDRVTALMRAQGWPVDGNHLHTIEGDS
jgi:hypothetical protein